jgi:microcin C transport system substrate-binding protein
VTSSRTRGCAGALNFAYNFEDQNKNLFFGQYQRVDSFFFGTELASSGLPQGEELDDPEIA